MSKIIMKQENALKTADHLQVVAWPHESPDKCLPRGVRFMEKSARLGAVLAFALSLQFANAAPVGGPGIEALGGAAATVCGTVRGGLAADGTTRANAVEFSGGGNSLTLENGFLFEGSVVSQGGDTLALGGDDLTYCGTPSDGQFDVSQIGAGPAAPFQGFDGYRKTGSSTWALTGNNTAPAWAVDEGELQVLGAVGDIGVSAHGVLSGSGSAGDIHVQGGGTVAPGAPASSVGTLQASSLHADAGSRFDFQLGNAPGSGDFLTLGGDFARGTAGTSIFHFSLIGDVPQAGARYPLVGFAGVTDFSVDDFEYEYDGPGTLKGHFELSAGKLDFVVDAFDGAATVAPIPTLSHWALLLLAGLLGVVAAGRRRWQS